MEQFVEDDSTYICRREEDIKSGRRPAERIVKGER